ncbi:unnamed protein product, partial [Closterium sp. NIES-65]
DVDAPKVAIPADPSPPRGAAHAAAARLRPLHPQGPTRCPLYGLVPPPRTDDPSLEGSEAMAAAALYTRFKITATDISMSVADGPLTGGDTSSSSTVARMGGGCRGGRIRGLRLDLLQKCGLSAVLHQLPPPRGIAVWLPCLAFHYSPARYRRLMRALRALSPAPPPAAEADAAEGGVAGEGDGAVAVRPWQQADQAGDVCLLQWTRIGSAAEWVPYWAALVGPTLYLLDHPEATKPHKQINLSSAMGVLDVPPQHIAGYHHVIALAARGAQPAKAHNIGLEVLAVLCWEQVVLSGQAVVLRLKSEALKAHWAARLTTALYHASAPASMDLLTNDAFSTEAPEEAPGGGYGGGIRGRAGEAVPLHHGRALDDLRLAISSVGAGALAPTCRLMARSLLAPHAAPTAAAAAAPRKGGGHAGGEEQQKGQDGGEGVPVSGGSGGGESGGGGSGRHAGADVAPGAEQVAPDMSTRETLEGAAETGDEGMKEEGTEGKESEESKQGKEEDEDEEDEDEDGFADAEAEFLLSPTSSGASTPRHGAATLEGDGGGGYNGAAEFFDARDFALDDGDAAMCPALAARGRLLPDMGWQHAEASKRRAPSCTARHETV